MNANTEPLSLAEECASHRLSIAGLIRERSGLTEEERAWFDRHGLHFDAKTSLVTWSPPPGESSDLATERHYLLNALHLLIGPQEPITEGELAEALACGKTFGEQLADLGVPVPKEQRTHGE